jgi:hypothetical protein
MAREVGQVLGEISEDEHEAGRPMLSAVAVGTSDVPGQGFFVLAKRLGKISDIHSRNRYDFWNAEREKVYGIWVSCGGIV